MRHSQLNLITRRRLFDPTQPSDLLELKHFVEHNRWIGSCPFYLEEYWDNIPSMCLHKYAVHMLGHIKARPKKTTVKVK